ncbi:MAG TPA: hypothetical protein VF173_04150, partial [Thermoanaerobaculia bacterium]|nr:hypothetical protein [Thermoanaerobaculia bacterium]
MNEEGKEYRKEEDYSCGYAPRVLCRLPRPEKFAKVLFVGAKDGSVTVLLQEKRDDQKFQSFHLPCTETGKYCAPVRVLLEWGQDRLLVGRDDGRIDVIRWRDAIRKRKNGRSELFPPPRTKNGDNESVRYATWLGENQLLVSYRHAGTGLYNLDETLRHVPEQFQSVGETKRLGGIRLAARIESSRDLVLIDSKGKLWHWSPNLDWEKPPREIVGWKEDAPPATFDDVTYVGHEDDTGRKAIRALILATDTGVFALDLRERSWQQRLKPQPVRLALPGSRLFCMAVTYVQSGQNCHLWLTNRQGESFLFENEPLQKQPLESWALGFRNSRLFHAEAQALTATSWPDGDRIWLARACRDDRIRIYSYAIEPPMLGQAERVQLLQASCKPARFDEVENALKRIRKSLNLEDQIWPGYALLAEYIEAQVENDSDQFFEFLSRPSSDLAVAILTHDTQKSHDPSEAEKTIKSAVKLWNFCLIGAAHRQSNPKEEWYLGILRFLRGLEFASFQDDPKGDLRACLSNSVDQAIRFARKWGLYGEVNEIRQNLVRPLAIYRRNQEVSGKLLDKLTYSSLLFRRSFSEVCQDRSAHGEGNHAWAIKALPLDDITIIAVSWRRKGIALFVVDSPKELSEVRLSEVKLPEELGGLRDDGADQYAYSRDLLLMRDSSVPKGFILLTSKRQTQDSTWTEEVKCWTCKLKNEGSTWILESPTPAKLQGLKEDYRGSAYRFLDISREELGVRHVLVGLEGREGRAELAELKIEISTNGTVLTVEAPHSLGKGIQSANEESRTEVPRTVQRNRVWSLAKTKSGFVAGSDNGEIWHVPLDPESKPTRVGKLASAVTALAANDVGGKIRVYAGSRDGTLIAFQEVTLNTTPRKQSFTTLWATVEKSEITYIGRHKYRDGKENFDLVLAIVQNGMCIAFDDSKKMKAFEARDNDDSKHPQRPPFPGIRWLRTGTDRKCFAAVSLPSKSKGGNWGLLALASEDGQLDLLSLHYPRYTERRKAEFSQHFEDLWNVAKEGVEDGQPENLRVIEATYRSAPLIPLIVVRLLLDPSRESENTKHLEKLALWWFPKFLRPLREFRTDWEAALTKTGELSKEASERVKQALETVLETAWRRRDVDLFQEVCALALKRSNFMLCEPGEHSVDSMKNLYFAIFDTIRNALQKWLGSELDKEARARIIVAKNLVDGDTAYRLFSILQQPDEQNRDAWQGILRRRIDGVRQLVWKGNLIVSLESLRAANHSLLRTCRRLSDERKQKGDGLTAIQWVFFKEYFLQLVAGAVQALGSNLRLRDALTHEYARTFALCLSACPEGAVQMTALLAETRLIVDPRSEDDLATRIESQLTVLKDTFCIGVHCWIEFVFASALRPDLDNLLQEPPGLQEKWWSEQPAGILRNDWKEVKNLYAFVTGLDRFASELAGADRERSQYEFKTLAELKKIANEGLESQIFRHSWRFWNDALQEEDKLKAIQTPPFQARIRPDVVLSSRDLAAWADKWAEKLEERYREAQIFQPEYGLFKEVLDRLRRAALAFPKGAAVQKNLVVGILGHHLLEDLDLHVLDLREIARNLDPLSVDADDDEDEGSESGISTKEREDQRRSIESDFAALLVRREKGARSLPKNLRTLAKVLNPEEPEEDRGPNGEGLRGFLEEFCKSSSRNWGNPEWKGGEVAINSRERELLRLVLDELDQNHQHHSGFEGKRLKEEKPKVLWEGQE